MDIVMQRDNERSRIVWKGRLVAGAEQCAPELGTSEVSELPAAAAHLLTADDVLAEGHRVGAYLALCGALVPAAGLPSSLCPEDCQCDLALYCPECVRRAAEWCAK